MEVYVAQRWGKDRDMACHLLQIFVRVYCEGSTELFWQRDITSDTIIEIASIFATRISGSHLDDFTVGAKHRRAPECLNNANGGCDVKEIVEIGNCILITRRNSARYLLELGFYVHHGNSSRSRVVHYLSLTAPTTSTILSYIVDNRHCSTMGQHIMDTGPSSFGHFLGGNDDGSSRRPRVLRRSYYCGSSRRLWVLRRSHCRYSRLGRGDSRFGLVTRIPVVVTMMASAAALGCCDGPVVFTRILPSGAATVWLPVTHVLVVALVMAPAAALRCYVAC
ncbi:hypothetical protein F5146DRAFT_1000166 [Armillaria mellea]|nr:hypothetical protein F5146DRAFT_1000166 [Armillaria mellea]